MAGVSGEGSVPSMDTALSPKDVLKACSFFARSESLRSLELPLELLLSGVIYLSGGRDKRGSPLLSITQPDDVQLEALMEMSTGDVVDMLSYFTSVPKDDARAKGFSVLLSAESIHDFLLRTVVKALCSFQQTHVKLLNSIFFVSATRNSSSIELVLEGNKGVNLPMVYLKSNDELLSYVDQNQLTKEFGGTLEYFHQDWVKFRLQVEPFICDCLGISKRLAVAMEPLLEEAVPRSIEEAESSVAQSRLKRQRTLDSLHIEELTTEGRNIDQQMSTCFPKLQDNPEFNSTLHTVQKLVDQINNVKSKLDILWNSYHMKLETTLRKHRFEKDTEQVVEWFEECADEFFIAQGEIGESLEVAEAMQQEVENFEQETQQILIRSKELLKCGSELKNSDPEVRARFEKIQTLITRFDERLSHQKKQLAESVRLHRLTKEAFAWCVRSMVICSNYDLLNANPDTIEPLEIKQRFCDFLSQDDTFTDSQLQELSELAERASSPFTKENAIFACNRVTEMTERFVYYQMILDKVSEEKSQRAELEANNKQQLLQHAVGVAEAMDVLVSTAAGVSCDVQPLPSGDKEPAQLAVPVQVSYVSNEDVDTALELLEKAVSVASGLTEDVDLGVMKPIKADISGPAPIEQAMDTESKSPQAEVQEPEMVENQDLTTQTKNVRHRRRLMEELLTTEETYIQSLEHICKHYLPIMENGRDIPAHLRDKKDAIFVNIPQLIEFNKSKILPKLQECKKCPIKLGQVFIEEEESFLQYSLYFKAMPCQSKVMIEGGTQFFASTQHAISDSLPLDSYLIKPFQRVTKYKLFLDDMIKHVMKSDLNGKLKECYDHLKESQKMIDFILRHGNDLLALDCLTGFQVNPSSHGTLLRQGELTIVEKSKHRRTVFLFENTILFAKSKKAVSSDPHSPDVFEFRAECKTRELSMRENIVDYPTRFELKNKQKVMMLQTETVNEKNQWVEEIRELLFSHMLQMKEAVLETHHAAPLSSIQESLVNPLVKGSYFGHTMRRAVSMRLSASRELLVQGSGRPYSTQSGDLSFIMRPNSGISQDYLPGQRPGSMFSNRSSVVSTNSSVPPMPEAMEKNCAPSPEALAGANESHDPERTITSAALLDIANLSESVVDSDPDKSVVTEDTMGSSQEECYTMTVTPV